MKNAEFVGDWLDWRFPRLQVCWYILRGRSVMYRVHVKDGVYVDNRTRPLVVKDCMFEGGEYGIRMDLS